MSEASAGATTSVRRRKPAAGLVAFVAVLVLLGLLAAVCVPHPVGAAQSYGKYEGKAVTTAKSALSDVATVQLAARTASEGRSFGPYVSVVISDAEEGLSKVQGTFDSIQPPNEQADKLQSELDQLLSDALDHVRDVRVAARRGELTDLAKTAQPLGDDAKKLQDFMDSHK